MAENRKPEEDELVKRLIPDPAQGPPNATPLRGYLGRAPAAPGKEKEPSWRLYRTPALDEYAEIPESEILHTQKLPDEQGSIVWVPKTLPVHYVTVQSSQVQAEQLGSGPIAQGGLYTTPTTYGPAGTVRPPTIATVCTQLSCPTMLRVCVTVLPICPAGQVYESSAPSHCTQCPPPLSAAPSHCTQCRSHVEYCPPLLSAAPSHCTLCPTHVGYCPPPSALPSHCTLCPTPTATASHTGYCPPPLSATPSHCTYCPPPSATPGCYGPPVQSTPVASVCGPCATPTAQPSHLFHCPPTHTVTCTPTVQCPVVPKPGE